MDQEREGLYPSLFSASPRREPLSQRFRSLLSNVTILVNPSNCFELLVITQLFFRWLDSSCSKINVFAAQLCQYVPTSPAASHFLPRDGGFWISGVAVISSLRSSMIKALTNPS